MNRLHFGQSGERVKLTDVTGHMHQPPDLWLVDTDPDCSLPACWDSFLSLSRAAKGGGGQGAEGAVGGLSELEHR